MGDKSVGTDHREDKNLFVCLCVCVHICLSVSVEKQRYSLCMNVLVVLRQNKVLQVGTNVEFL